MLENAAKILWFLVLGAFTIGGWSAVLEYRVQDHGSRIPKLEEEYTQDQKQLIGVLGRMDERLKNIENKRR